MRFILILSLIFCFGLHSQAQSASEKLDMMNRALDAGIERAKADKRRAQEVRSAKIDKQKRQAEKAEAREKKGKVSEPFVLEKTAGRVYVFGVSQSLGRDSVFITEICTIDSMALQKKTDFLPYRSSFSIQMQRYTEGVLGQSYQTVSVFFSDKMEKLAKTQKNVKKRYLSNTGKVVNTITHDEFYFIHPLDMITYVQAKEEVEN